MQRLRDLMRTSLARSLQYMAEEDRLAAALPLACGSALAQHCEVVRLDEDRTLHLRIQGAEWFTSMLPMRQTLQHDLARIAGVPLAKVHFLEADSAPVPRRDMPVANKDAAPIGPMQTEQGKPPFNTAGPRRRRPPWQK